MEIVYHVANLLWDSDGLVEYFIQIFVQPALRWRIMASPAPVGDKRDGFVKSKLQKLLGVSGLSHRKFPLKRAVARGTEISTVQQNT